MGWPRDPAIHAHCRRVAALATEIASRAGASPDDLQVLRHAALLHHYPPEFMDKETVDFLLTDRLEWEWAPSCRSDPAFDRHAGDIIAVLTMFHSASLIGRNARISVLADAVATADLFLEEVESPVGPANPRARLLHRVGARAEDGLCCRSVERAVSSLPEVSEDELREILLRLPVFPPVVFQVLSLAAGEEVTIRKLEKLLCSDDVLAARLASVANSSLRSPGRTICTVRQAIACIGLDTTRRIAVAAAVQPLFASPNPRDLWHHSLQAARLAERLAAGNSDILPEEAFLAGLVHDVGRLAIGRLPGDVAACYARLLEQGCEPLTAELFLLGFDHGELGAKILRHWNFPDHVVEAVASHHQQGRTVLRLASLLHAVEAQIAPGEAPALLPRATLAGAEIPPEEDRELELLSLVAAA